MKISAEINEIEKVLEMIKPKLDSKRVTKYTNLKQGKDTIKIWNHKKKNFKTMMTWTIFQIYINYGNWKRNRKLEKTNNILKIQQVVNYLLPFPKKPCPVTEENLRKPSSDRQFPIYTTKCFKRIEEWGGGRDWPSHFVMLGFLATKTGQGKN